MYTSADVDPPDVAARLEVTRMPAEMLTMTSAVERLLADHGVRSVLCEGGPTVLGALLAEGLVDELFLSLSPRLAGGHGPGIVEGPAIGEPAELRPALGARIRRCAVPSLRDRSADFGASTLAATGRVDPNTGAVA